MPEANRTDEDTFVLESEQLDALRQEVQTISPDEQERFKILVRDLHQVFIQAMSPFLSKQMNDDEVASKFITVDSSTLEEFQKHWIDHEGKIVHSYVKELKHPRTYIYEGNFFVGTPVDLWGAVSQERRDKFLASFQGSEELAREFVNKIVKTNVILHEITHLYQKPSEEAPLWLIEAQAYWLARTLPDLYSQYHTPEFDLIADFYQTLLDKHGEVVHKVCFGTERNGFIAYQITRDFTPEIQQKIFPEYDAPR